MNLDQLTKAIKVWAENRNLHSADPSKQMLKLMEEVGELAQGFAKNNGRQVVDSIGDIYVVLTILSMQIGMNIEDCVEVSYNEIKDRNGKMINGVFVKEEDL
ncbi:MazG-like family protein [Bacillus niameyensis]|uniref:MazG-like family protein n=1 Tax=Bacillus niameyensis TaxID=1522308 RepID=UPI000783DC43|nr:MazG-like family protein [Bacillus niameyensis]